MDRVGRVLAGLSMDGLVSAYAFGSVAEGRSHAESDIDLGILLDWRTHPDARARFDAQLELRRHLSPGSVRREVDLVVLNDASPMLGRRIVGAGHRVYCADPEADHAFRRAVQLLAADLDPFLQRMRIVLHASLTR